MGVRLETRPKRFLADNAGDDLPRVGMLLDGAVLTAADLPAGSTVLYADSGKIKRWNGSEWSEVAANETQEALLAAILAELQTLNQRLAIVTA